MVREELLFEADYTVMDGRVNIDDDIREATVRKQPEGSEKGPPSCLYSPRVSQYVVSKGQEMDESCDGRQ